MLELQRAAFTLLLCVLGGLSTRSFPGQIFRGSPVLAAFPFLAEESGAVLLCFHPSQAASLLPAAEVVLAGARLAILSEISFILKIMMTKKEINFLYNLIPGFPRRPDAFLKSSISHLCVGGCDAAANRITTGAW